MANKSAGYRAARVKAFREILRPAGFMKGRYLFVRKAQGQLQGIDFQTSKWGGEYFINVTFQYDFLPPYLGMMRGITYSFERFHVVDFMLYTRLGNLMPRGYPKQWQYGEGVANLDEQVRQNAIDAISVLDALGERWRDPTVFLDLLPPPLLQKDYQMRLARAEQLLPYDQAIGPEWMPPDYFKLGYCLSVIALRARLTELAKAYLDVAEAHRDGTGEEALANLRGQLQNRVVK